MTTSNRTLEFPYHTVMFASLPISGMPDVDALIAPVDEGIKSEENASVMRKQSAGTFCNQSRAIRTENLVKRLFGMLNVFIIEYRVLILDNRPSVQKKPIQLRINRLP